MAKDKHQKAHDEESQRTIIDIRTLSTLCANMTIHLLRESYKLVKKRKIKWKGIHKLRKKEELTQAVIYLLKYVILNSSIAHKIPQLAPLLETFSPSQLREALMWFSEISDFTEISKSTSPHLLSKTIRLLVSQRILEIAEKPTIRGRSAINRPSKVPIWYRINEEFKQKVLGREEEQRIKRILEIAYERTLNLKKENQTSSFVSEIMKGIVIAFKQNKLEIPSLLQPMDQAILSRKNFKEVTKRVIEEKVAVLHEREKNLISLRRTKIDKQNPTLNV